MNLCLLDDPHSSLEDAFAFLDRCDDDEASELSGPYNVALDLDALLEAEDAVLDSPAPDHENVNSVIHSSRGDEGSLQAAVRPVEKRQRATKKHRAIRPTAPRRRTKTDILELREQVIQLTARIDRLNNHTRVQSAAPRLNVSRVANRALKGASVEIADTNLEREKLYEAEALNAKLKIAWGRQLKLCKQLQALFSNKLTPADVESLFGTENTPPMHNALVRDNSLVFVYLSHFAEQLYDQATAISALSSTRGTTRMCSSSQMHQDARRGEVFEFTTNTPLACELSTLEKEAWCIITNAEMLKVKPNIMSHETRKCSPSRHESQFTRRYDCQFGSILVNGVSMVRKFVEPHRIVITFTSTLALAGTELTFREVGWLIMQQRAFEKPAIAPNTLAPPSSVLLQTCYRMYPDNMSAASRTPDGPYFVNFILQSHCETMRIQQLHLQSYLFSQLGASATPACAARARAQVFPNLDLVLMR